MSEDLTLSAFEVAPILEAREEGKATARTSPDLGLSTVEVSLEPAGTRFPDGELLTWEQAAAIMEAAQNCFILRGGALSKAQVYSEYTSRFASLMPTGTAPTFVLAGFPMHRIKGIDPLQDTRLKVKTIAPLRGRVLDTSTGLGYTAIEAAKTADEVVTIELDPAVLDLARLNPWSRELFRNPRITQIVGDSYEEVTKLADESFSRIIHDPPVFSLAGELYSGAFYAQLLRILRRGGRLFHYIGDLQSKSGQRVAKGAIRRLYEAGFERVVPRREAFGVVAYK